MFCQSLLMLLLLPYIYCIGNIEVTVIIYIFQLLILFVTLLPLKQYIFYILKIKLYSVQL